MDTPILSQMIEIVAGNFATGTGNQGNFNAYDSDGNRRFVHKRLMESKGWKSDVDLKDQFPFFAIGHTKQISVLTPKLDDKGNPVLDAQGNAVRVAKVDADGNEVKVERLELTAIFKTEQEMLDNQIRKNSFGIKVVAGIQKQATDAGLTEPVVNALLTAVV